LIFAAGEEEEVRGRYGSLLFLVAYLAKNYNVAEAFGVDFSAHQILSAQEKF